MRTDQAPEQLELFPRYPPTATVAPQHPDARRRMPVIDCCPICRGLHLTVEEFNACKTRGREQL